MLKNWMSFNICGSIGILGHACAELKAYNRGGRSKKCFLEISQFEQRIGISGYFAYKVHDLLL